MALRLLHRILIVSAIALGVLLVFFAGWRWLAGGDSSYVPMGAMGAVFAVGLAFYLRWFLRKASLQGKLGGPRA